MREKWNTLFKKLLHTEKKLINKVQFLLNYTFLQILSYYTFTAYLYRNFEPRLKVRNFLAPFELGGVMDLPLKNNKKNFFVSKWRNETENEMENKISKSCEIDSSCYFTSFLVWTFLLYFFLPVLLH